MMGTKIIFQFIIFFVTLAFFTAGLADENQKELVRRKRNIICTFGLTGILSRMCYDALESMHKYDPQPIDPLLDGKLYNGVFKGLSTLRNVSKFNVDCVDELVLINTLLVANDASINYQWKQNLLLTFKGSVWTTVKELQFDLELTLNMTRGIRLDVTNFKLSKLDGMRFGFNGLGLLNPLINVLGNFVLTLWKHKITEKIEEILRNTLESELSKFKLSF